MRTVKSACIRIPAASMKAHRQLGDGRSTSTIIKLLILVVAGSSGIFAGNAIHTHNPPQGPTDSPSRDIGIDGWRWRIHHELFSGDGTSSSSVGGSGNCTTTKACRLGGRPS